MSYGSIGYTKAQYASTLAATLAYFLYLQGDAVGLLTFDQHVREYLPARHRTGHLRHLMLALDKPGTGEKTDLSAPLKRIVEIVRKRGLIILISDFLAPPEKLDESLSALAACGHEIVVFQILDPAERDFDFKQPAMFEDVESGRVLFIDPGSARAEYVRKMELHSAALRSICQRLGILWQELSTSHSLHLTLFDFLRELIKKKKNAQRFSRPRNTTRAAVS